MNSDESVGLRPSFGLETNLFTLTQLEQAAARALGPEAPEYLTLCDDIVSLLEDAIEAMISNWSAVDSVAARANLALLIRLGQDLRTASIVAGLGYSTQALSIVAGSFEVAFTIAYIGDDEGRAEEWRDHHDPTRPFLPVRRLVSAVIEENGLPKETSESRYRALSSGLHGKARPSPFHEDPFPPRGIEEGPPSALAQALENQPSGRCTLPWSKYPVLADWQSERWYRTSLERSQMNWKDA